MIAPSIVWLATALVLTGSVDLFGQEAPLVAQGDRVRVTAPNERVVGTFAVLKPDTLVVNVESRRLAIPFASVTSLEVSRGQKSRTGRGALIGLGVGVVAGVGTALALCAEGDCNIDGDITGAVALVLGAGGALVGAGIGALIGSQTKTDRWETVPLDRIHISLTPRGGGLEVSAKFVF